MNSWSSYENIEDMPNDELCSYCFGAKLRLMQTSPYSVYNDYYAETLKNINLGRRTAHSTRNPVGKL